tara:strand:- start:390 stop:593 length:204 start_codon:yes stop_codon:yes gene_type:complete
MSTGGNIRFNGEAAKEQPMISPEAPKVDLNNLIRKLKEEEKKTKRNSLTLSVAALSAVAVFGIILTL